MIGPSGSGKSTPLRTLNRLCEPDKRDILLGMVFQHFNLFRHRSVLDT